MSHRQICYNYVYDSISAHFTYIHMRYIKAEIITQIWNQNQLLVFGYMNKNPSKILENGHRRWIKVFFFYYAKKRTWNLDKNILYANKDFIRNMQSQIGMWFLPLNKIESLVQHSDGIGGDFERTEEYPTLLGVAGGGSSLVGDSLASGRRCSCTEANLKGCEML